MGRHAGQSCLTLPGCFPGSAIQPPGRTSIGQTRDKVVEALKTGTPTSLPSQLIFKSATVPEEIFKLCSGAYAYVCYYIL